MRMHRAQMLLNVNRTTQEYLKTKNLLKHKGDQNVNVLFQKFLYTYIIYKCISLITYGVFLVVTDHFIATG
jgi:hypothetical protein